MSEMKKIFLFIVEGISEKNVLEPIVSELLDNKKLVIHVLGYDATLSFEYKGMKERVIGIIKSFLNNPRNRMFIRKQIF